MRIISFGGLTLPENNADDEYTTTPRTAILGLREGGYDQDGGAVNLRNTIFRRRVQVLGDRIDEQMDTLKLAMLRGRSLVRAQLRDNRLRVTYGKMSNLIQPAETTYYTAYQVVTFSWSMDYPYWIDNDHLIFADDGLYADNGEVADGNYSTHVLSNGTTEFSINYQGTGRGTLGAFCFVPRTGGTLSAITITNLTNGLSLTYNGSVAAGDRLDIDWQAKTVYNASTPDSDNLSIPNPKQMEWFALEPGGNNIRVTCTVATANTDLYFQWVSQFA